jgi:hypothetical protein
MKNKRIAIIMDGGLIQDIVSDCPELLQDDIQVFVADYDIEMCDEDAENLMEITQDEEGKKATAYVYETQISEAQINLDELEKTKTSAKHPVVHFDYLDLKVDGSRRADFFKDLDAVLNKYATDPETIKYQWGET